MKALIWNKDGSICLVDKDYPQIKSSGDAIVKVTLSSICTSDLHIIKGFVPKALPGTTLGHEFVGEVVEIGSDIKNLKPGDRVAANCETFCGECYFCRHKPDCLLNYATHYVPIKTFFDCCIAVPRIYCLFCNPIMHFLWTEARGRTAGNRSIG